MRVTFREARREDVPAVVALLADDALGATRERGGIGAYLSAFDALVAEGGNILIVGEADGAIVATCQLTFISGLSHRAMRRAQVESVRVAPALRGRGIGAEMMRHVEERARAAGCGMVQLTTHASRNRARAFYDGIGFTASHVGYKRMLDS